MAKQKIALIGIAAIVAATAVPPGYAFVPVKEAEQLEKLGQVELNRALKDDAGSIATRATDAGAQAAGQVAAGSAAATSSAPAATTAAASVFVIEDAIPLPSAAARGRVGGSKYPFDKLAVGQSFFVGVEAKKLGSTVSSANARYAEEIPGQTRTNRSGNVVAVTKATRLFVVRPVEGGARIWRTL